MCVDRVNWYFDRVVYCSALVKKWIYCATVIFRDGINTYFDQTNR